jgi:hypothetical protein
MAEQSTLNKHSLKRFGRRFILAFLLLIGTVAIPAGCSMMPKSVRNLPAKFGMQSEDNALKAKVDADKFPTAKEAGL